MRKKAQQIQRAVSIALLMVFAIALTPFSIFHHHETETQCISGDSVKCLHKEHLRSHAENCLICSAHFEKDYTRAQFVCHFYHVNKQGLNSYSVLAGSYTTLIGSSLRGPPLV